MKNSHGFSLMEILVAMILLAAVSTMAFSAFSSGAKISSSKNGTALNVARAELEELYEYVRQDWRSSPPPGYPLANGTFTPGPTSIDGTVYTPTYVVTGSDINGDGQDDYRKVTMTISWT